MFGRLETRLTQHVPSMFSLVPIPMGGGLFQSINAACVSMFHKNERKITFLIKTKILCTRKAFFASHLCWGEHCETINLSKHEKNILSRAHKWFRFEGTFCVGGILFFSSAVSWHEKIEKSCVMVNEWHRNRTHLMWWDMSLCKEKKRNKIQ